MLIIYLPVVDNEELLKNHHDHGRGLNARYQFLCYLLHGHISIKILLYLKSKDVCIGHLLIRWMIIEEWAYNKKKFVNFLYNIDTYQNNYKICTSRVIPKLVCTDSRQLNAMSHS